MSSMKYTFTGTIETETPLIPEIMQILMEKSLSEMNVATVMNTKETPSSVKVVVKK